MKKQKPQKSSSYLASQKKWLLQAFVLSAASFIVLKLCFPLPDIDLDGINYVSWAYHDVKVAYRPLGYPHFLRMLHNATDSIHAVAFAQYLIYVISLAFAFFSVDYLLGIPPRAKQTLIVVAFLNPLLLFQANTISSDSLFCSLTIMLITLCIWFAKKADWRLFVAVIAVLYFCLAVRFASLFYPFLLFIAIAVCRAKILPKLAYAGCVVAVVIGFIQYQKDVIQQETNAPVFSGFSGWQTANNALYCYKKIEIQSTDFPTPNTRTIDSVVRYLIDSVKTPFEVGDDYLWNPSSPLRKYTQYRSTIDKVPYYLSWFQVSEDLNEYGWYIIKKHPLPFVQYYLYPNFKRFLYPNPSPLDNYNSAQAKLPPEVGTWFNWKSPELTCRFPQLQKRIIAVYPFLSAALNVFNVIAIMFFFIKAIPVRKKLPQTLWLFSFIWAGYYFTFAAFSIFASAVYLRFLDTVFALSPAFSGILLKEAIAITRGKAETTQSARHNELQKAATAAA